jgi:hypothetical protein
MSQGLGGIGVRNVRGARGRGGLIDVVASRPGLIALAVAYALVIHLAHAEYLGIRWGYYGFSFNPFGAGDFAYVLALSIIGALFLPRTATTPSSVVLWQLFVIVYVPIVTISMALTPFAFAEYGLALAGLCVGFVAACRIAGSVERPVAAGGGLPSTTLEYAVFAVWIVSSLLLIVLYRDVVAFSALDEIYAQRELTSAEVGTGVAYLRTYYSGVISPLLIITGLLRRNWLFLTAGLAGFVFTYAIDAQKITLAMPLAIIGLHRLFGMREAWHSLAALTAYLFAFIAGLVLLYLVGGGEMPFPGGQTTLDIAVFRMIALPGLTFTQYADLFGDQGLTYWSNTRGISLVVPPPAAFANDPSWPNLGYIVGDHYYGSRLVNANANPFSGEGVAAAGPIGVVVIGCVLGVWLRVLNWTARGWDPRFATLVMVPVGLSLTNGHLATVLLTFGGAMWPLFFLFGRKYMGGNRLWVQRAVDPSPKTGVVAERAQGTAL